MTAADLRLILLAQQGDRAALDSVLREHQGSLHRYIATILGDRTAAEDVLQETLFRIARKLQWLAEPQFFRTWAFRIASREAYRALAARRPAIPLDEVELVAADPPPLSPSELAAVRVAVTTLSPASRGVVALHYLEEMPLAEVGDALELPLGTVKSRLAYGLTQLRKSVKDPR
jgi:RNA polymerase sigma-70 factor (ECF subfamily)